MDVCKLTLEASILQMLPASPALHLLGGNKRNGTPYHIGQHQTVIAQQNSTSQ